MFCRSCSFSALRRRLFCPPPCEPPAQPGSPPKLRPNLLLYHCNRGGRARAACPLEEEVDTPRVVVDVLHGNGASVRDEVRAHLVEDLVQALLEVPRAVVVVVAPVAGERRRIIPNSYISMSDLVLYTQRKQDGGV